MFYKFEWNIVCFLVILCFSCCKIEYHIQNFFLGKANLSSCMSKSLNVSLLDQSARLNENYVDYIITYTQESTDLNSDFDRLEKKCLASEKFQPNVLSSTELVFLIQNPEINIHKPPQKLTALSKYTDGIISNVCYLFDLFCI